MITRFLLVVLCVVGLAALVAAGGHGGGHKKVIIHVPLYVKHHHHKHTIVKHVHHHHKPKSDDHYEVLGYTYGKPEAAPHGGGGHWGAADEGHDSLGESPVSFEGGDHNYALSSAGDYSGDVQGY